MSYVRQDQERAEHLYDQLTAAGYRPWMDSRDLLAGQLWRPSIQQAIRDADFFLACLSKNSVSKRGFLQKEIRDALRVWEEKLPEDIYVIPLRLEDCEVPEGLSQFQWIDLFAARGWSQLTKVLERPASRGKAAQAGQRLPPQLVVARGSRSKPAPQVAVRESSATPQLGAIRLPIVTFPDELRRLIARYSPDSWRRLGDSQRRFAISLGAKLEPIVQIAPPTPVPLVVGFECLALGPLGENFDEICLRLADLEPGLLRLLLMFVAMKTASLLRVSAAEEGNSGARHLLFTVNLDPETIDCPYLEDFLRRYFHFWEGNSLFEVNEETSSRSLDRLKTLQADFGLRYCADDFNNWNAEVKMAFRGRVEMTKLDPRGFQEAMARRGDAPGEVIERIALNVIPGKGLIVEGVEDSNQLRFLESHWRSSRRLKLFGQGYSVMPGHPWEAWTDDLRGFGLPGGHILAGVDRPGHVSPDPVAEEALRKLLTSPARAAGRVSRHGRCLSPAGEPSRLQRTM